MVSSLPRGSSIMRARRRACAISAGVSRARASRSSVAASSTARPARSLRRVIADMAPIAWPAWIENAQAAAARRPSEEKVAPVEGQVVVGKRGKRGAVDPDLDGARVDLDPGIRLVVEHVLLADLARARDGQGAAAASHVSSEFGGGCGG